MSRIYCLSYDTSAVSSFHPQLLAFVDGMKDISSWSQPFPGLILLLADEDMVVPIGQRIGKFFNNQASYWLSSVSKGQNFILLPEQTWDWLKETETGLLTEIDEI